MTLGGRIAVLFFFLGALGCSQDETNNEDNSATATDGLVLFVQEQSIEPRPIESVRGLSAKILREDQKSGALAVKTDIAAGWRDPRVGRHAGPFEIYVLEGTVSLGPIDLSAGDFVRIPRRAIYGPMESGSGAELLWFFDGPADFETSQSTTVYTASWTVARDAETPWVEALVAREAGVELDLEVKNLRNDPSTGARTFLVRAGEGVVVPWETHPVSEEGYLLDGEHRLEECLPSGLQAGTYQPGGYFFRPPDLMHMGPGSTYEESVTWLIRTPGKLVDVFYDNCPYE